MTEDQQLLNADVQEEFTRLFSDRMKVIEWLIYIRSQLNTAYISNIQPEVDAKDILSMLSLQIYYGHMLWDRAVYKSFDLFICGKVQNIIRGKELKEIRASNRKMKKETGVSKKKNYSERFGRDALDEDEVFNEGEEERDDSDDNLDTNINEFLEVEIPDVNDEDGEDEEQQLIAGAKHNGQYIEPSISLNIDLIDKKVWDDGDPYIKYGDSFSAQFNKAEFENIVEMILFDPADTELLALFVAKYVEEKRREETMKEYGWTKNEYNAIYRKLLYRLKGSLPDRYREMVGE